MNEIENQILSSNSPVIRSIQKGNGFKVIAIGLNTGVMLKKHVAPDRAKIFVVKGKIEYVAESNTKQLAKFEAFDIPEDELHEVTALEPSLFLLIVGR